MGGSVDRLTNKLKKLEAAQARKAAKERAARVTKLERGYAKVTSGLKSMGMAAAGTAAVIGGALAYKMVSLADLAGRTSLAFKNMFGNEKLGEERLQQTLDLAERYGLGIQTAIDKTRMFKGLGFSSPQIDSMLGMGADMKALGLTAEAIDRVYLQLGQIGAKGKLQGEELIVLAENGISISRVYDRLQKKLGKTREEIIKMQAAGEIKSGTALNAIAESLVISLGKTELGKAGEEAADQTLGGLLGKMGTHLERGLFQAAKNAEPALARGMKAVFEGQKLADGSIGASAITTVLETIGLLLERIGPKIPEITENFTKAFGAAAGFDASSIEKFADGLPQMATRLGEIAGSLVSIAGTVAKLEPLFNFFSFKGGLGRGGMGEESKKAFTRSTAPDPVLEGLDMSKFSKTPMNDIKPSYWSGVWSRIQRTLGGVDEAQMQRMFGQGSLIGQRMAEGIAGGIAANSHLAEAAARNMAQSVDAVVRQEAEVHSPSKKMVDIGGHMSEGVGVGIEGESDIAISSARALSRDVVAGSAEALRSMSGNYGAITTGAAEALGGSGGSGNSISIGEIHIHIDGSGDTKAVVERLYDTLDTELADIINRRLEAIGA